MTKFKHQIENPESLAIRAAWLHYVGGLTQTAVAKRLGLTSVKTHRLISRAVADGAITVSIDGQITECVDLENKLLERFNLRYCQVAPDLGEEGMPLRALGQAGSRFLGQHLSADQPKTIGLSLGRSLMSSIAHLPRADAPNIRFVSLLGALTRDFAVNREDVIYWISEKTGAPSYTMPVPLFANTTEDRDVLLSQRGVEQIFEMASTADVKLFGIGTVDYAAQLVISGIITEEEILEISEAGAIGEAAGHFFDANGAIVNSRLTSRTVCAPLASDNNGEVVGIAGGDMKVNAMRAVLNSGVLTGLITDELTAKNLLN